jgi:transcriptional regulator with XRE-family HTH domain
VTKLKLVRMMRRMTQKEVAEQLDVNQNMISLWENGYYIRPQQLARLAEIYELPVNELRGEITLEGGSSDVSA